MLIDFTENFEIDPSQHKKSLVVYFNVPTSKKWNGECGVCREPDAYAEVNCGFRLPSEIKYLNEDDNSYFNVHMTTINRPSIKDDECSGQHFTIYTLSDSIYPVIIPWQLILVKDKSKPWQAIIRSGLGFIIKLTLSEYN